MRKFFQTPPLIGAGMLGVLHHCFAFDLDSIWQSTFRPTPLSYSTLPSGSHPGHLWRRSLAGKAAADTAMLGCQKAELRVQCVVFSRVNSNPTPLNQRWKEKEWVEWRGCDLTGRSYCISLSWSVLNVLSEADIWILLSFCAKKSKF